MNHELLEEFKQVISQLGISDFENVGLLLKLTKEDIVQQTSLCYQVTPMLIRLKCYADIYAYIDEEEQTELLNINQHDFFSKIFYITRLASNILGKLLTMGILHPVVDSVIYFEDMLDTQEDLIAFLEEIKELLPQEAYLKELIPSYYKISVDPYQQDFRNKRIPILRKAVKTKNYSLALNQLSLYIQKKLRLESGSDKKCSLAMSYLYQALQDMLDNKCAAHLLEQAEERSFIGNGLEEKGIDIEKSNYYEYFNLLLLLLDNRYRRQKSAFHLYTENQSKVLEYQKKCKKL